jgi:two-component sensor histidine kinase
VKNNLQIVGSLLSLQAARTEAPEAKSALIDALVRIDAMALGQRFLKDDGEPGVVSTNQLFQAWSSQLKARLAHGPRRLVLRCEIEERELSMDVAAPLVLIATEALMQAYRRATVDPLVCRFQVSTGSDGDVLLVLSVQDDPHAFARDAGVSKTLLQGYLRQIRGAISIGEQADVLTVRAPLAA